MSTPFFEEPKPASPPIREALFGDVPLDHWPLTETSEDFPWSVFVTARRAVAEGDIPKAIEEWRKILVAPSLEALHYVQAWHFLRQYGEYPVPPMDKFLVGIVIEVGMADGVDLLAAYADHTARYYNFTGSGVVWGRPDASLDPLVAALLSAAAPVVARIKPFDKPRPPAPANGLTRISFLTPSGIHLGQAPMATFSGDPQGNKIVQAGLELMQALIAKSKQPPDAPQP